MSPVAARIPRLNYSFSSLYKHLANGGRRRKVGDTKLLKTGSCI